MSWLKLTFELVGGLEETQAVYFLSPRFHLLHHAVECIRQLFDLSDFKAVSNPLCRVAVLKIQGIISFFLKAVPAHEPHTALPKGLP